jgi:hypothetical protein
MVRDVVELAPKVTREPAMAPTEYAYAVDPTARATAFTVGIGAAKGGKLREVATSNR